MTNNIRIIEKLQNTIFDSQGWHQLMGKSLQIKVRNLIKLNLMYFVEDSL